MMSVSSPALSFMRFFSVLFWSKCLFLNCFISSPLFCQLIPMMTVSCRRGKQVSCGTPSASLSSWLRGGCSWATTSSMWCLTWSLQRYWPPGQSGVSNHLQKILNTIGKKNRENIFLENMEKWNVMADHNFLSVVHMIQLGFLKFNMIVSLRSDIQNDTNPISPVRKSTT